MSAVRTKASSHLGALLPSRGAGRSLSSTVAAASRRWCASASFCNGTSVTRSQLITSTSPRTIGLAARSASAEPAESGTTTKSTCSGPLCCSDKNAFRCGAIDSTVTTTACLKPHRSRWPSGSEISGRLATGSSALGACLVSGSMRSPCPPDRITGVIMPIAPGPGSVWLRCAVAAALVRGDLPPILELCWSRGIGDLRAHYSQSVTPRRALLRHEPPRSARRRRTRARRRARSD